MSFQEYEADQEDDLEQTLVPSAENELDSSLEIALGPSSLPAVYNEEQ